ncbi:hypothetical protein K431DRAFT_283387 [Polychaeton citri CBS 116435]|uniref:SNF2 family helicase/ATPase n=1 Tax=Polychaeton citri CBS 116435 TaxID=1314669 RepID=A0A9P4QBE9_9PEZI|nr:hypothetical protein K431DRAFT_283387 [Polychaeton citri CBS 116435]
MNPAQFLDPKGWAKQQQQHKGKGRKRAPTGPKQFRKSTTSEAALQAEDIPNSAGLGFDPKSLLAPRGAGASTKLKAKGAQPSSDAGSHNGNGADDSGPEGEGPGMASFLERQHKLKNRQVEAPRKRKAKNLDDEDEEGEERRKLKVQFIGGSNGGVLGQYVKDEREKGLKQQESAGDTSTRDEIVDAPIDLTNDDDEIEITGENRLVPISKEDGGVTKEDGNEEICMGTLKTNVNAYRVPAPGAGGINKLNKDWWPKMKVSLKRQANSTNVIHFVDTTGKNFGQMVINAASGLCPLLDGVNVSKLRTKTYLDARKRGRNEAPGQPISEVLVAHTTLFCPRNKKTSIGRFLSQRQLFLNDPVGMVMGTPVENPHTLKKFGPSLDESRARNKNGGTGPGNARYIQRTQEEMRRDASTMFDTLTKASEDLPGAEAGHVITTPLMEHQKKALYFLLDHERKASEASVEDDSKWSLWKPSRQRAGWVFNVITGEEVAKPPKRVQGGILADVMGLGKTLSILALLATTLEEAAAFGNKNPTEEEFQKTSVECLSKATLIICPKSVMSNWIEQIDQHTSGKLKVYAYHGSNRQQDPEVLAKHDVVLTTYNTAAAEFNDGNRQTRALETIKWFRIVLDEAHQIRTASTKVSKACCALSAERRWAMTGTPVQNKLDDLGALIKFIRLKPFDESYNWAHYIIAPFKNADHNVLEHLQLLVHSVTLRRVKDTIELVGRREVRETISWSREERLIYDNFARSARIQSSQMIGGGGLKGKAYAHVLRTISRLRAICAHGKEMLSEEDQRDLENLKGSSSDMAIELFDEPDSEDALPEREERPFITENQAYEMLNWMRDSEVDRCSRCGQRVSEDKTDPNEVHDLSSDSSDEASDDDESQSDELGFLTQGCLHLICHKCEDRYKQQVKDGAHKDGYWTCPIDGAYVRAATFTLTKSGFSNFQQYKADAAQRRKKSKWEDRDNYSGQFSKVKQLMSHLRANEQESERLPKGEPPIRSVIFSGWTTYLDLIEFALVDEGYGFVRLDGSMSIKQRTAVLNTFKEDPETTILIVSIKAGGQGLNFTTANKVYMMEPQFNPGVEQQAIDRVHRLGQKRDVEIVHFVMQDSIEQSILELQAKKERLAKLSMDKKRSGQEEAKTTMQQLSELFK